MESEWIESWEWNRYSNSPWLYIQGGDFFSITWVQWSAAFWMEPWINQSMETFPDTYTHQHFTRKPFFWSSTTFRMPQTKPMLSLLVRSFRNWYNMTLKMRAIMLCYLLHLDQETNALWSLASWDYKWFIKGFQCGVVEMAGNFPGRNRKWQGERWGWKKWNHLPQVHPYLPCKGPN